jgi:hypothetical protein
MLTPVQSRLAFGVTRHLEALRPRDVGGLKPGSTIEVAIPSEGKEVGRYTLSDGPQPASFMAPVYPIKVVDRRGSTGILYTVSLPPAILARKRLLPLDLSSGFTGAASSRL